MDIELMINSFPKLLSAAAITLKKGLAVRTS